MRRWVKYVHCNNKGGGYTCDCPSGYESGGLNCFNVNECTTGENNCDMNVICSNTANGFTCICNDGFSSNGSSGDDVNE